MKRVVVTGATGFVGSHLIYRLLENDYKVAILCRNKSKFKNLEGILNKINIYNVENNTDKIIEAFNEFKPECVIHLAGVFKSEHGKDDIDEFIDANIKYPTNILEAMRICNIKNFINTGTAWQHYNNEEYNPVCFYAATKEAFEKIIEYYVKALEFKCITLTLFDTYGDNDERGKLISVLKDFAINNKQINMTLGNSKIDLTHIDDITNGFIKAIEYLKFINLGEHKKYALCTGRRLTLKEVVDIFQKMTGYKLNIKWGIRKYRYREIMDPWDKYECLPNWKSTISLEEGIKNI